MDGRTNTSAEKTTPAKDESVSWTTARKEITPASVYQTFVTLGCCGPGVRAPLLTRRPRGRKKRTNASAQQDMKYEEPMLESKKVPVHSERGTRGRRPSRAVSSSRAPREPSNLTQQLDLTHSHSQVSLTPLASLQ